jgi:hypothetical protein
MNITRLKHVAFQRRVLVVRIPCGSAVVLRRLKYDARISRCTPWLGAVTPRSVACPASTSKQTLGDTSSADKSQPPSWWYTVFVRPVVEWWDIFEPIAGILLYSGAIMVFFVWFCLNKI